MLRGRSAGGSVGLMASILACSLGCAGFMEDDVRSGSAASARIGAVTGSPLPSSAAQSHTVETTGIDWLFRGEVRLPRADATAWFAGLKLPCDQATVAGPDGMQAPMIGQGWKAPYGADWSTRDCRGRTHSGPHYTVAITRSGDPAWIAIEAMTL